MKKTETPENTYMQDMLEKIAKEQSEAFDKKAMETLNLGALTKLYDLCINELIERGVNQIRGNNIT